MYKNSVKYHWILKEFDLDNKQLLTIWKQIIATESSCPIANTESFMLPLMAHQFPHSTLYIAMCYVNDVILTVIPFMLTKKTKYFWSWFDLGTPFHLHVNLFCLPNCALISKNKLFKQLIIDAKSWPVTWDRLVIRNLICSEALENGEYAGNMAWFDTSSSQQINDVLSRKLHRNFRRLETKLHDEHEPYSLSMFSGTDTQHSLNKYFVLEERCWRNTSKEPIKGNHNLEDFYHKLMSNYEKNNKGWIFFYHYRDHAIAGALGFLMGKTLYIHKICFDPAFSKFAPGGLLMLSILESALENKGIDKINLVTYPEWAKRWHPECAKLQNFVYYNTTIQGWFYKITVPLTKKFRKKLKSLYLKLKKVI